MSCVAMYSVAATNAKAKGGDTYSKQSKTTRLRNYVDGDLGLIVRIKAARRILGGKAAISASVHCADCEGAKIDTGFRAQRRSDTAGDLVKPQVEGSARLSRGQRADGVDVIGSRIGLPKV